jgi:LacI family transcriptional regulator
MANRRPTQEDVAKLAGVSQTVVSQILNNNEISVSEDTRQRVIDAIDQLGYVPNKSAQNLRSQKTRTIACVIPDITNPYYPAFQRGIQKVTTEHNFDLFVYDTEENEKNEVRCLQAIQRAGVDGAILVLFHHQIDDLAPLLNQGIHLVVLASSFLDIQNSELDIIYNRNDEMAELATNYLIEKGHTKIGMIAGLDETPPRKFREIGYLKALEESQLPLDQICIQGGDFTEKGGYEAMKIILNMDELPTAIFAANDLMALGAMVAIREAGLQIPDDIALIGIDDIPAANLAYPRLTTINQHQEQGGMAAAEMLIDRIEGKHTGPGRMIEGAFELIERESV